MTFFGRRTRRALAAVVGLLVGAELLYLLGANLFLSFGGISKLFEATSTINAKFERAWTIWPGHVQIRNLRVVFQDVNLEWSLDIASASVVLDLSELASRTFHARSVQGEGAVYRFRHRVDPWSANEPSVRVLPPIPEFPGTAVFEATVPEAPVTDADYNLWTVHLEQVDVGVSEVWMQQFRYVGAGRARGSFRLRSARTLWVGPASLDLEPGRLAAGAYQVSPALSGRIECVVHPFDVRKPVGRQVLRFISARLGLRASNFSLSASRLFLPEDALVRAEGGELRLDVRTDHGKFEDSSRLELTQEGFLVEHAKLRLDLGRGSLIARAGSGGRGEALLRLEAGQIRLPNSDAQPLKLHQVQASIVSSSVDTTADWAVLEASLLESRVSAPDVRWFNGLMDGTGWTSSAGASELSARARYKDGELQGEARASFENVRARSTKTKLVVDGQATFAWSKARILDRSGVISASLIGEHVRLERGTTVFEAAGLRVDAEGQTREGAGRARLTAKLGTLRARAGRLSMQTEGELAGELETWDLSRGTASTRFAGELRNLDLRALDAGLRARAKRASLRVRVEPYNQPRSGRHAFGSRLSVDARLHQLELEQGSGEGRTVARAGQLLVSSRLGSRANREIDAVLHASAQGFEAGHGRMWLKALPELQVNVKGLNQEEQRGQIHAELVVRAFSASDTWNDSDCPWSRIALGTLRADAELRGDAGARIRLAGELSRVRLAWGDFSTTAESAHFETDFDEQVSAVGTEKLLVAVGLREAKLRSGPRAPLGWDATLPALDFTADLSRTAATFSGPIALAAEGVRARIGRTTFQTDLAAEIALAALEPEQREARGAGTVRIRRFGLKIKEEEVKDWWANVAVDFVNISAKENLDLASAFRATFRDALPALTVLAAEGDLPGFVPDVFPLRELEATGMVSRRCRLTDFRVTELKGGPLSSRGRVQSVTEAVSGAFLVRLDALSPIAAGLSFDDKDSNISLFAGTDWLTKELNALDDRASRKQSESCEPVRQLCGD